MNSTNLKSFSATQNNTYTGPVGELTADITNWDIRLHDGATPGGHPINTTAIGGTNTDVQFNDSGTLGGVDTFTFDKADLNFNVLANKFQLGVVNQAKIIGEDVSTSGSLFLVASQNLPIGHTAANIKLGGQADSESGEIHIISSSIDQSLSEGGNPGTVRIRCGTLSGPSYGGWSGAELIMPGTTSTTPLLGAWAGLAGCGFTFPDAPVLGDGSTAGGLSLGTRNADIGGDIVISTLAGLTSNGFIELNVPNLALQLNGNGGELRINTDPGSIGQVITSQGAGTPPVWADPAPVYTLATLPTAIAGLMITVSDANSGAGALCYSDGSTWKDARTNATVV